MVCLIAASSVTRGSCRNTVMRMNYVDLDVNKSSPSATMDQLTGSPYPNQFTWTHIVLSSVAVTVVMLIIITGNSFVIVAIVVDRRLKTLQNWFIVSLAVSDLLVGVFIMPLSLANELMGYWYFGRIMCDLWLATDVLLCTASILNLCLISLDRYWSVVRAAEGYSQRRTRRRVLAMIATVWVLSVVISLPPLVGWKRPQPTKAGFPLCVLSEEPGYVIYSSVGSFFLPLVIMILVYFRLYQTAVSRARRSLRNLPLVESSASAGVQRRRSFYQGINAIVSQRFPFFKLSRSSRLEYHCVSAKGENFVLEVPATPLPVARAADESVRGEAQQGVWLNARCGAEMGNELELACRRKSGIGIDIPRRKESVDCGALLSASDASTFSCNIETTGNRDDIEATCERRSSQGHCHRGKSKLEGACLSVIDKRRELQSRESALLEPIAVSRLPKHPEKELDLQRTTNTSELPIRIDLGNSGGCVTHDERRRKRRQLLKMGSVETGGGRPHGRRRVVRAREKRATLVLGLVMASFIGCWLPFFSTYVIVSLMSVSVTDTTFAVIFWLGYCNSALNPVIYTIFNRDFRSAFLRLVFRKRVTSLEYRCPI